MEELLAELTPAQADAVQHVNGPLLILAGPGSGKTRVVTRRIAWLLAQGIPARQILALTFTNKAADEMKARVAQLAPGEDVWLSTFHRFCAKLLRSYAEYVGLEPNFTIYDTADSKQALRRALAGRDDLTRFSLERIAGGISTAKNNLLRADDFVRSVLGPPEDRKAGGDPLDLVLAEVYPAYERILLADNAVDFDGLLLNVALLLKDNPEVRKTLDARYRYILVDEYQDTNFTQYAIVRALSLDYPNLCVTGDPDQSIYGWRGANVRNILDFERDYPDVHVVRLEQNYRSTRRILRAAQSLIEHNRKRKHKDLFTENEEGAPVRLTCYTNQKDEAEGIVARLESEIRSGRRRPRDCAVLYRINALSREVEEALRRHGLPYQVVHGVEFYQRKEVKDTLAFLQLLNNPRNSVALERIINVPPRGIGERTVKALKEFAAAKGVNLLEAARRAGLVESIPKRAALAVAKFVSLFDRLSAKIASPMEELLGLVLSETGYKEHLENSPDEHEKERVANLDELLTVARLFDEEHGGGLEEFLERASLTGDTDEWEGDDKVTLMTLHAAKGLEFPVVAIPAIEENLLPHEFSKKDPWKLEEERRLLFVGITRAQQELWLSHVAAREFRGRRGTAIPSSFLMELPRDEFQWEMLAHVPAMAERSEDDAAYRAAARDALALDELSEFFDQVGAGEDVSQETHHEEVDEADADDTGLGDAAEPPTKPSKPAQQRELIVTTAAALAGGDKGLVEFPPPEADKVAVDDFYQGMVVRHPEYGIGKIMALSGTGAMRRATVAFVQGAGEKKFILSQSPLRPAKRG